VTFAAYQPAGSCTGKAQLGTKAFMKYVVDEWRNGAFNMGIYNCRNVAGTGKGSLHGEGRALDVGFKLVSGRANPAGTKLVKALLPHVGKLGIQCIIWNRTIWTRSNPGGVRYKGKSPHYDHVHIELSWAAARGLTLSTMRSLLGGRRPAPAPVTRPQPTPTPVARPQEDDVYVVKANEKGLRVTRAQKVLQAAGKKADLGDLLPRSGPDGVYGAETVTAVNKMAAKAQLPQDGHVGFDVLLLDYCRNWLRP
jgi:hypothetical protein